MLVEATNRVGLIGAPTVVISLTSLRVTPLVSPSARVEATTPSYRMDVLVRSVIVVPWRGNEDERELREQAK